MRAVNLIVISTFLAACSMTNELHKTNVDLVANTATEAFRPAFHFTPPKNWMNDPNGMVYYQGEYHLFYQHNPHDTVWGPMYWGHAISKDMVNWEHQPIKLFPDEHGTIFSGSAVIEWQNTSGLGSKEKPPMVAIFTYGFVHIDLWHIVFNMLVLYFVGRSFSNLFNTKLSLNIYFLGILSGGLLFILVALLVPDTYFASVSGLIGASAGVHAALLFLCVYMPEYEIVLVRFRIKLKYLAMAFILFDVIGLFGDNRGGNVAHIGGDLLGIYYALQLQKGKDIAKRFEGIANIFVSWFSWSKKSQLKTVHKNKNAFAGHSAKEFKSFNNQKQIDIILDKISKSGYDSLNAEEKEFLFKAGKK